MKRTGESRHRKERNWNSERFLEHDGSFFQKNGSRKNTIRRDHDHSTTIDSNCLLTGSLDHNGLCLCRRTSLVLPSPVRSLISRRGNPNPTLLACIRFRLTHTKTRKSDKIQNPQKKVSVHIAFAFPCYYNNNCHGSILVPQGNYNSPPRAWQHARPDDKFSPCCYPG